MSENKRKKAESIGIVGMNLLLVSLMIFTVLTYISDYQKKLYDQNVRDIANINGAAANISSEFFASQEEKLSGIIRYLERHDMKLTELLQYLDDTNAGELTSVQLVGTDYTGYDISVENGDFPSIDYSHADYKNMQKIFANASDNGGSIAFSSEFTDQISGERAFARYAYVSAEDEDGTLKNYTLMAVSKASFFIDLITLDSANSAISTVLVNNEGQYILRNSDYKSDDFFKYIYTYNDFTLDQMNLLKADFQSSESGEYRYLNASGEDCVFVYVYIPGTDWYCVSSVPVSTFHDDGSDFWFTITIVSILFSIMVLDFVWLAELNKRLRVSADEAHTASEAKTDFLSRMSHDIRTPINVITGMTELALDNDNPPETASYLEKISGSGKFLLGLVNDILDMNKVESGMMELHPKPYSFDEFGKYINAVIEPLCTAKNIEFKMTGGESMPVLVFDSLRLNQIFFNLLSNSVKFTHEGGHVSFDAAAEKISETRASVSFTVKDDGIGMSEEFCKNMFNAFAREERSPMSDSGGTGLGLAIVKSLVDLMNGSIYAESELGKGTVFHVRLEADIAENYEADSENVYNEAVLKGKHILLCEDHPLNAQIINKLLGSKGIQVTDAENGQKGLELFAESAEDYFDAVLMDIRMPVMNGLDAAKAIRALSQERRDAGIIPIIALTANAYDSDVQNCLNAGMNAHLAKPIDSKLLFKTLSGFIENK